MYHGMYPIKCALLNVAQTRQPAFPQSSPRRRVEGNSTNPTAPTEPCSKRHPAPHPRLPPRDDHQSRQALDQ